jgi:hypothetical protein
MWIGSEVMVEMGMRGVVVMGWYGGIEGNFILRVRTWFASEVLDISAKNLVTSVLDLLCCWTFLVIDMVHCRL